MQAAAPQVGGRLLEMRFGRSHRDSLTDAVEKVLVIFGEQ